MVAPAIIAAGIGAGGSILSSLINKKDPQEEARQALLTSLAGKQGQVGGGPMSQPMQKQSFSSFLSNMGGM